MKKARLRTTSAGQMASHTLAAQKMLIDAELINKDDITKKKTADEVNIMMKDYKMMRSTANESGWRNNIETYNACDLSSPHGTTVEEYIKTKCPWFYKSESVFIDHPDVKHHSLVETTEIWPPTGLGFPAFSRQLPRQPPKFVWYIGSAAGEPFGN